LIGKKTNPYYKAIETLGQAGIVFCRLLGLYLESYVILEGSGWDGRPSLLRALMCSVWV